MPATQALFFRSVGAELSSFLQQLKTITTIIMTDNKYPKRFML
jgi:hypothetical protein